MDVDLASASDLAALSKAELVRVSASIPRAPPRTFALLTACLVFPLSLAVLAHSLFTHPILLRIHGASSDDLPRWLRLFAYQFLYLVVLLTFSLLSTAAAVFTVASLYAAKPASTSASLAALPSILPRLLRTFLWVALLMLAYHLAFFLAVLLLVVVLIPDDSMTASAPRPVSFVLCLFVVGCVFFGVHVYISALWHLASVVSVLEPPLCGLAAMAKSRRLLQGRTGTATSLVADYLAFCTAISLLFRAAVVQGRDEEGSFGLALPWRLLAGAVLVCALVCVNLLGLLVQSVFYYSCKAFHNQKIDRAALYEHLGGYLGEYVPLKGDLEMENLH